MFIESSYPQLENQKARLLTPAIYSDKQCLEFYYHMWGNGKAVLNILTKSESGLLSLPAWSRNQNYGNKWNLGQVTITSPVPLFTNQKYQIAFCSTKYVFQSCITIQFYKGSKQSFHWGFLRLRFDLC